MAKVKLSREQAQEKRRALVAKLEQGYEQMRDSDRYRDYLAMVARFHNYSAGNCLLIMMQRPTASRVAGFQTWKGLGRMVRKGEKGIAILAPMVFKRTDDDEDERTGVAFRTVHVFDVAQTDGDELPASLTEELEGVDDAGLYSMLERLAWAQDLEVKRDPELGHGGANGWYNGRQIWVRPDVSLVQATKTLAHELGHHFAGHMSNNDCREGEEITAESIAFVVLGHYGIDAGAYSFGYLAHWAEDGKQVKARMAQVQELASTIIEGAEAA